MSYKRRSATLPLSYRANAKRRRSKLYSRELTRHERSRVNRRRKLALTSKRVNRRRAS